MIHSMNRNSPVSFWVVLIVGIIVICGVYLLGQSPIVAPEANVMLKRPIARLQATQAAATETPSATPSASTASSTSQEEDTAGWQICRNDARGYQLKLPSGWREFAAGGSEAMHATCDQNINTIVWAEEKGGVPVPPQFHLDIEDQSVAHTTGGEESTTVEGYLLQNPDRARDIMRETRTKDGERVVWFGDGVILTVHGGIFYVFGGFEMPQDLLDKIMATFKFTR
jgi:hypothetical protein